MIPRITETPRERFDAETRPVVVTDPAGRLLYFNPSFGRLVRFDLEGLVGRGHPLPFLAPRSHAIARPDTVRRMVELGVVAARVRLRDGSGSEFQAIAAFEPVEWEGQRAWLFLVFPVREKPGARICVCCDAELCVPASLGHALDRMDALVATLEVSAPSVPASFSAREREVAEYLSRGWRAPAIARRLALSPHTVRNHLKSMFRKTGTRSQEELFTLLTRGSEPP